MHHGLKYVLQNGNAFHHELDCSGHEVFTRSHKGGETADITYEKIKLFHENLEKKEEGIITD